MHQSSRRLIDADHNGDVALIDRTIGLPDGWTTVGLTLSIHVQLRTNESSTAIASGSNGNNIVCLKWLQII